MACKQTSIIDEKASFAVSFHAIMEKNEIFTHTFLSLSVRMGVCPVTEC